MTYHLFYQRSQRIVIKRNASVPAFLPALRYRIA